MPGSSSPDSSSFISTEALVTLAMIFIGLFVGYLFIIKPQQEQKKEEEIFLKDIKLGSKVVTLGGIHGKISDMNETQVLLVMEDGNSHILVEKRAISTEATQSVYGPAPKKKTKKAKSTVKKKSTAKAKAGKKVTKKTKQHQKKCPTSLLVASCPLSHEATKGVL